MEFAQQYPPPSPSLFFCHTSEMSSYIPSVPPSKHPFVFLRVTGLRFEMLPLPYLCTFIIGATPKEWLVVGFQAPLQAGGGKIVGGIGNKRGLLMTPCRQHYSSRSCVDTDPARNHGASHVQSQSQFYS